MTNERQKQVDTVLHHFRTAVPPDELDEEDWDAIRVAVRIAFETEDLARTVESQRIAHRDQDVESWFDSMGGAVEFMSWVRDLSHVVTGTIQAMPPTHNMVDLWRKHRTLIDDLVSDELDPAERLMALVQLGGLEIMLWGMIWPLSPTSGDTERAAPAEKQT